MKKFLYISLALAAFLLIAPERSFACSCIMLDEPLNKQIESAFTEANAVFSGEVVEVRESADDSYSVEVTFKTAKTWKGDALKTITISTGQNSAMCGFNFEVGKTYLVYAHGEAGKLSTTICTRTAEFKTSGDVKQLNKLKKKKKAKNS